MELARSSEDVAQDAQLLDLQFNDVSGLEIQAQVESTTTRVAPGGENLAGIEMLSA
jgi:hypothetical protein